MKLTATVLLLCLLGLGLAWWDKGHMITAQIAYKHLENTNRTVSRNQFQQLVAAFYPFTDGKSNSFIEAAVWADDIKAYKANFFDSYHFVNIVYDPGFSFKGMTQPQADVNAINTINWCLSVLKTNKNGVTFERAFMARYLLHLVGDIHQPLHSTQMYNDTYKTGDHGGNLIHILTIGGVDMNLHAYFDSIALDQDPDVKIIRPLSSNDRTDIENQAKTIMVANPIESFGDRVMIADPHTWGVESYQLAVDKIYSFFKTNKQVTQKYQSQTRDWLYKQLALGGYRLANAIASVYA